MIPPPAFGPEGPFFSTDAKDFEKNLPAAEKQVVG